MKRKENENKCEEVRRGKRKNIEKYKVKEAVLMETKEANHEKYEKNTGERRKGK